jgi:hypothetical protein
MEIKKLNNHYELFLDETRFVFDPPKVQEGNNIILTNISLNLNKDKIFNAPGEYNVEEVFFWGFNDKNSLSYLFQGKEGKLLYAVNEILEENIKKIRMIAKEIDALFFLNFFDEKVVSIFKPKIILTNKKINLPKFEKQKGAKLKINFKKVEKLIFIFD